MAHGNETARGAACGLAAAALFGASAPVSKLLLPSASPLVLSSLLYLGAGIALSIVLALRSRTVEAPLRTADWTLLAIIAVLGGAVAPVLMLSGLRRTTGVAGSLLLNLEAPFTIFLALAFFREHAGAKVLAAAALIVAGGALLGVPATDGLAQVDPLGAALIAGACACWAIDNNLSQRLSSRDPLTTVRIKALSAGVLTLVLAIAFGESRPVWPVIAGALLLGSASYGLSIVLDMYALRLLGAAREAAFFATAPFVGALLAIPLLGDRPTMLQAGAAMVMIAGVVLLARERHRHLHTHDPAEHEHVHVHDDHHQHAHDPELGAIAADEPHSHPHRHAALTHDHPHTPDIHHRHRH